MLDRLAAKTEEEAWEEALSYLDKKQNEKRKRSFERSKLIYASIVGIIVIIFVIISAFFGLTSRINLFSLILLESLIFLSGLFIVLRIYFVGVIWTPLLFLISVYINQKYGNKQKNWTIENQIEFL